MLVGEADEMKTHVEDVICELPGISEREELPIDLLELYPHYQHFS